MIWFTAALATCTQTKIPEIAAIPAPAVIVLGERMGVKKDLSRARKLLKKLQGPKQLAVAVVDRAKQQVLERHNRGELPTLLLEKELGWSGFPFTAYSPLFTMGVAVRAVGVPVEPKPEGTPVPLPAGYARLLSDGMAGHMMPADLESSFSQLVAWYDHRVALHAVEGWNGKGYLVVLADRTHVEGGKGISWQLQRLTEAPVHAVMLADPGACYSGDQHF